MNEVSRWLLKFDLSELVERFESKFTAVKLPVACCSLFFIFFLYFDYKSKAALHSYRAAGFLTSQQRSSITNAIANKLLEHNYT